MFIEIDAVVCFIGKRETYVEKASIATNEYTAPERERGTH